MAAEPITDLDTTAADVLETLIEELAAADVTLVLAELKHPVRDKLVQYELDHPPRPELLFRTLDEAIATYTATYPDAAWQHGAPWAPNQSGSPEDPR